MWQPVWPPLESDRVAGEVDYGDGFLLGDNHGWVIHGATSREPLYPNLRFAGKHTFTVCGAGPQGAVTFIIERPADASSALNGKMLEWSAIDSSPFSSWPLRANILGVAGVSLNQRIDTGLVWKPSRSEIVPEGFLVARPDMTETERAGD
jgi:hypothetical protein